MPVLRNLALAALAAGAVAAVRKRQAQGGGRGEADLWAEATSGPNAVSTPTAGR